MTVGMGLALGCGDDAATGSDTHADAAGDTGGVDADTGGVGDTSAPTHATLSGSMTVAYYREGEYRCTWTATVAAEEDVGAPWICHDCDRIFSGTLTPVPADDACFATAYNGAAQQPGFIGLRGSTLMVADVAPAVAIGEYTQTGDALSVTDASVAWGVEDITAKFSVALTFGTVVGPPLSSTPTPGSYACGWKTSGTSPPPYTGGYAESLDWNSKTLPDAVLRDQCGDFVRLHDFVGRYLVVIATALDCQPCQLLAENEQAFVQTMGGYDVQVINVTAGSFQSPLETPSDDSLDFYAEHYSAESIWLADRGYAEFMKEGGVNGWPTIYVVGPDLSILGTVEGPDWATVMDLIRDDATCTPACAAKGWGCGDDLCGGTCGTCGDGLICAEDQTCKAAVAGDGCGSPFEVGSTLPFSRSGDISATVDENVYMPLGACDDWNFGSGPDQVWRFVPPADHLYRIAVESENSFIGVYMATTCPMEESTCVAAANFWDAPKVIGVDLEAGKEVFITVDTDDDIDLGGEYTLTIAECTRVCQAPGDVAAQCGDDGCGGSCGTCDEGLLCEDHLCRAPDRGDNCTDPFVVDALPFTASSTTSGQTSDHGWAGCPTGYSAADQAYAFVPATSGDYTVTLVPQGDFGGGFYVTTACEASEACIAGMDDGFDGDTEVLELTLTAGTTYYIIVTGYFDDEVGAYTLNVAQSP